MLAESGEAELTLLHVVDDDQPQHLVEIEVSEAAKILNDLKTAAALRQPDLCKVVVTAGAPHRTILDYADAVDPDLIVMGAPRKQILRDIIVGTTVERVIRTGRWPVLMVNNDPRPYESAMIALDLSEASESAIRSALSLNFVRETRLGVVHAFDPAAKSKLFLADVAEDRIANYIEQERQLATGQVQSFLAAHSIEPAEGFLFVEEGDAINVISQAVEAMAPDLVIVGTHARTGFAKVLLGSVAEQVLRSLTADVLVVSHAAPPGRPER